MRRCTLLVNIISHATSFVPSQVYHVIVQAGMPHHVGHGLTLHGKHLLCFAKILHEALKSWGM